MRSFLSVATLALGVAFGAFGGSSLDAQVMVPPGGFAILDNSVHPVASVLAGATSGGASVQVHSGKVQASVDISTDKQFLSAVSAACDKAVASFHEDSVLQTPENLKNRARMETKNLIYFLNRYPDRERAKKWNEFLCLDQLKNALATNANDLGAIEKALKRFQQKDKGLDLECFTRVRDVLKNYLDACSREKSGNLKDDFEYYCKSITEAASDMLRNPTDPEIPEVITVNLDSLEQYQPNSQNVRDIANLFRKKFIKPNLEVSVSSKVIFPEDGITVSRPTTVREIIRGTPTYGSGTISGVIVPSLVPNDSMAEVKLTFRANIKTDTTAVSPQGVTVLSNSNGNVIVTKSIFFNGSIVLGPTASASSLESVITGVNTGRGPIASQIVYGKINQEYPYSKAESQRLMEQKVVSGFESEVGKLSLGNEYLNKVMGVLRKNNFEPKIWTSSNPGLLNLYARLGSSNQIGPVVGPAKPLGSHDVSVNLHQSALNNAFHVMLAGKRLSETDIRRSFAENFPELDLDGIQKTLEESVQQYRAAHTPSVSENTAPAGEEATEAEEGGKNDEEYCVTFYRELPMDVVFNNDSLAVHARIDSFEQSGKTYPGLDIEVVYQLEERNGNFVLVLQKTNAWPPEIEPGTSLPARFQVIRGQILKRMNSCLPAEIPLESIPIMNTGIDMDSGQPRKVSAILQNSVKGNDREIRGILNPGEFMMRNGWFQLGLDYAQARATSSP